MAQRWDMRTSNGPPDIQPAGLVLKSSVPVQSRKAAF